MNFKYANLYSNDIVKRLTFNDCDGGELTVKVNYFHVTVSDFLNDFAFDFKFNSESHFFF